MVKLQQIYRCSSGDRIADFDVHQNGKLVTIEVSGVEAYVSVAGRAWLSWRTDQSPHLTHVRWWSEDSVVLWSFPIRETAPDSVSVVSEGTKSPLRVGTPLDIFPGSKLAFVCYGESQYLGAAEADLESNMVIAVDLGGSVLFGLRERLAEPGWPGVPVEVSMGCVTSENSGLFSFYDCDDLWLIEPYKKSLSRIMSPWPIRELVGISMADDRIALAKADGDFFRLGLIDRESAALEDIGSLPRKSFSEDGGDGSWRSENCRLRGLPDGSLAVATDKSVWKLTLR